jgi:hypothetical protein
VTDRASWASTGSSRGQAQVAGRAADKHGGTYIGVRGAFLASMASFNTELDVLAALPLTGDESTTSGVVDTRAATEELSKMSNEPRTLVGQFRI